MSFFKALKKFELFFLILIINLGIFLRFYNLSTIPLGLYTDEALFGYNAYSILQTGKDEYGKPFPVFFRSLGDYQMPLYSYLSVPVIYFFGLSIFSARVVAAISGVLGILLIYLILKQLPIYKNKKIPLIGAFLFAITPWSIYFSRAGFETNLGLCMLMVAVYLFLLAKKSLFFFLPACIILSLSTYSYSAERLIAYLLLPLLVTLFISREKFKFLKQKITLCSIFIFILIQIPNFYISATPAFKVRPMALFYKQAIDNQAEKMSGFILKPVSVTLAFVREFSSQFSAYFSPRNLFFNDTSERDRSMPEQPLFFFWLVIPYLVGSMSIFKNWRNCHIQFLFILMFVFAVVPSLTKDPFASSRALPLLLPLSIVITIGVDKLISSGYRKIIFMFSTVLLIISAVLFWRSYFILYPNERAKIHQYGYGQLVEEIKKRPDDKFIIDQSRLKPSYIELVFLMKYPPKLLQQQVDQSIKENYYTNINFNPEYRFANVETRNIQLGIDSFTKAVLVGDEYAISPEQAARHKLTKIFEIKDPIGNIIFQGYETSR